ncbi:hypothetical protein L596_018675 [Steinernema carpocapsae]|uniref:Uncharacterized protein n=1 Tax=Steinernema carpocapsae TaxID=34508 RepID=A0A4U5N634_STECR|nr:hypothetical protein L596_018675 [Steinernema carpocapsae]
MRFRFLTPNLSFVLSLRQGELLPDFEQILDAFEDLADDQAKAIKTLEELQMTEFKKNAQKDRMIERVMKRMWNLA